MNDETPEVGSRGTPPAELGQAGAGASPASGTKVPTLPPGKSSRGRVGDANQRRPRLLDLCCGAGGATRGYQLAGFYVVGVDHEPQPHYCGDEFYQADALTFPLEGYDAVHASPPCQAYTELGKGDHPRLIAPTRERLLPLGIPYVIENVVGARRDLRNPVKLCGSTFGLHVKRHRLFESNVPMLVPPCHHPPGEDIRAYYGKPGWLAWSPGAAQVQKKGRRPLLRGSVEQAPSDMGIDWMATWDELREAIPPAFSRFIGEQLLAHLGVVA